MTSADADVLELLEHASRRLLDRLSGLEDDEWSWTPLPSDSRVSIRWRLDHIAETLSAERNWRWLGVDPGTARPVRPATSSGEAIAVLHAAVERFVELVRSLGDAADEPIGPAAGQYASATRRSFVLHVVDELVHHGAEAALLRDLAAELRPDGAVSRAGSSGRTAG